MRMSRIFSTLLIAANVILLLDKPIQTTAELSKSNYYVSMPTSSVNISSAFGTYQIVVDKNIYNSINRNLKNIMTDTYGTYNTSMFTKACGYINPCMAFATTWGEAGSSYAGVSLTTVMDFNPDTYIYDVDWIEVSRNLEQVNSDWYYTNALDDYNTNVNGNAYHIPDALLQYPSSGSRETSSMTGLGVGPYQITSSDWDTWVLDNRVSPVDGFKDSLKKAGTDWIECDIDPISDLTVYAAMSLSHQGGALITYDFGKNLINKINTHEVQDAFDAVGYQMYIDLRDKAYSDSVDLSDINLTNYLNQVESATGIDFSSYTGGVGRTNKGNYVALHCLRYVFYKNYFTRG